MTSKLLEKKNVPFSPHRNNVETPKPRFPVSYHRGSDRGGNYNGRIVGRTDRNDGDTAERWRRATVIWQKRETITVKVNRWEPPPVTGS